MHGTPDRMNALGSAVIPACMAAVALVALCPDVAREPVVIEAPRHCVDLSEAPASELAILPSVGPSLAARIVADRARNGGFATHADLSRVRGVGPATLEALRAETRAGRAP